MRYSAALVAAVAAVGANAQINDPNKPETYNALVPFTTTPSWPSNFGGSSVVLGKIPSGCADLEIIVARGTSEPGDLGAVAGDPLVARVKQKIPGARGYPVQYPASAALDSMTSAVADINKRIKDQMQKCPNEKLALVGYSQGAMAMHLAASQFDKSMQDKIIAEVMFGDPGRIVNANFPGSMAQKVYENCANGDPICGGGINANAHLTYNDRGTTYQDKSASFIVDAYNGRPQKAVFPGK